MAASTHSSMSGMRASDPEVDVGLENQVPVAHILGEVQPVAEDGGGVEVQVLGVFLVEPHDHGELLPLLVAVGDSQRPLEPDPVVVRVLEEDAMAPEELLLLGVRGGDPLPLREVPVADPEVGEVPEGLNGEEVAIGSLRLLGAAELPVLPGELP